MPNREKLDDTSDALLPVSNPFDIPLSLLTEIIQEAIRASKSKNISKQELEKYLNNSENWRVKALIAGSISNMVIRNDIEGEHCLQTLNSFPEEQVIHEIVRLTIGQLIVQKTAATQRKQKKSSARISVNQNSNTRKDSRNSRIESSGSSRANKGNNNLLLISIGLAVLIMVVGGIIFFNKQSSQSLATVDTSIANNDSLDEIKVEVEKVKDGGNVNVAPKPEIVVAPVEKIVETAPEPSFEMIEPKEGTLNLQVGRKEFYKADVYSLEGSKKITFPPYIVNGNDEKVISRMFFDLRHISKNIKIESAKLMINVSFDQDSAKDLLIYCYSSEDNLNYNYSDLVDKIPSSARHEVVLRNEMVTFDVTNACKKWINEGKTNNGFWLYTDKKVRFLFQGFESQRLFMSPKILIHISEKTEPKVHSQVVKENKSLVSGDKKEDTVKDSKNQLIDDGKLLSSNQAKELPLENVVDQNELPKVSKKEVNKEDVGDSIQSLLDQVDDDSVKTDESAKPKKIEKPLGSKKSSQEIAKVETEKQKGEESLKPLDAVNKALEGVLGEGPEIVITSKLLNPNEKIIIKNKLDKGEIRYTSDGSIPAVDSDLLTEEELDPSRLLNKGGGVLKTAVFLDGKIISKVTEKELRVVIPNNLIDNNFARCRKKGKWDVGKNAKNQNGRDYLYVYRNGKNENSVTWQPLIKGKTKFEIYIWLPDGDFTRADNATYVVHSKEGDKSFVINQKEVGKTWIYLGTFEMDSSTSHNLELIDDKPGKVIIADAAYFHPVESGD